MHSLICQSFEMMSLLVYLMKKVREIARILLPETLRRAFAFSFHFYSLYKNDQNHNTQRFGSHLYIRNISER